jgi:uncharacterized protein
MSAPHSHPPRPPLSAPMRYLLLVLAWLCVVLAIIGAILPGMPTTVFVLMAAWAAARSSPRFSLWLESHRLFGPMIRDWRDGGYVSRRAKWSAALTMALSVLILFLLPTPPMLAWGATGIMTVVLVWLCLRPERKNDTA